MTSQHIRRISIRAAGVVLLILLWEANSHFAFYRVVAPTLPAPFFPSLSGIVAAGMGTLSASGYHAALLLSVGRTIASFGIAGILGILVALVGARSATFDDLIHYPAEFFRQLPAVAIIPFAIMLFGIYSSMKIAVAVFGCFFPVLVATREGLGSVDSGLMLTARTYGWKGPRLLFGVMLPSAVPHIIASLRVALAIALILVIIAEMLVGGDGLGVRIVERERTFDFPGLYAETLLLGIVGVVLNQLLSVANRKLHYWREERTWRPTDAMATRAKGHTDG